MSCGRARQEHKEHMHALRTRAYATGWGIWYRACCSSRMNESTHEAPSRISKQLGGGGGPVAGGEGRLQDPRPLLTPRWGLHPLCLHSCLIVMPLFPCAMLL